jgi:hypothetical protein
MAEKITLDLDKLEVVSFATYAGANEAQRLPGGGGMSFPDVCTCIGICQPTEDIYCSGGCPPDYGVEQY